MPRVHGFRDDAGRPYVRVRVLLPRLQEDASIDFLLDTGADLTSIHRDDRDLFGTEAVRTGSGLSPEASMSGIGGAVHTYAVEGAEYVFQSEDGPLQPLTGRTLIALDPGAEGVPPLLGRDILDLMLFCISEREITLDW